MVTDFSPDYMRRMCPLLGINERGKTDTDIQILFWKSLYEHTVAHVGQLHEAFERLITQAGETPDDLCQRTDDMALFIDHFLTGRPFDMLVYLQSAQSVGQ